MSNPIMEWFEWDHLPEGVVRDVSKEVADLAHKMDSFLPDSAEKSAGLRKLMEGKDCLVRSALKMARDQSASSASDDTNAASSTSGVSVQPF